MEQLPVPVPELIAPTQLSVPSDTVTVPVSVPAPGATMLTS